MAPDLLDTLSRARQAYASVSELRPELARASENATSVVGEDRQAADMCAVEGFERSAERFWELAGWLAGGQARDLEHSQLAVFLSLRQNGRIFQPNAAGCAGPGWFRFGASSEAASVPGCAGVRAGGPSCEP